jgi:hypothetical protein
VEKKGRASRPPGDQASAGCLTRSRPMADPAVTAQTLDRRTRGGKPLCPHAGHRWEVLRGSTAITSRPALSGFAFKIARNTPPSGISDRAVQPGLARGPVRQERARLVGVGLRRGGLAHVADLEVFVRDEVVFAHEIKSGLVRVVKTLATHCAVQGGDALHRLAAALGASFAPAEGAEPLRASRRSSARGAGWARIRRLSRRGSWPGPCRCRPRNRSGGAVRDSVCASAWFPGVVVEIASWPGP